MSGLDLKAALFLRPEQVAEMFGHSWDKKGKAFVYRHAAPGGFLHPYAKHFGSSPAGKRRGGLLMFHRAGIERLVSKG